MRGHNILCLCVLYIEQKVHYIVCCNISRSRIWGGETDYQDGFSTMSNVPTEEKVLSVEHFTDRLFAFSITRPPSFRFRTRKPVGTLVLDALLPGKRLWMFSTGTGFAPFASLVRDPETYERYDEVIVTHTCREAGELEYSQRLVADLINDPLVGEMVIREDGSSRLKLITSLTREDHPLKGRITTLIESHKLFEEAGTPPLDPSTDRVMICGSKAMIDDTAALVETFGLKEGSNSQPAEFVVEKSFVG